MQTQVASFLEFLTTQKSRTPNTIAAYKRDLTQFLHFVKNRKATHSDQKRSISSWQGVTGREVEAFLIVLQDEYEYATATVARKIAAVNSFLSYLEDRGTIDRPDADKIRPPKVAKTRPQSIRPEDVERLLKAPSFPDDEDGVLSKADAKIIRDRAILEILYATGMRVSELVEMDVDDFAEEEQAITCGIQSGHARRILLPERAFLAIERYLTQAREYLAGAKESSALFLNHRGKRLTRQGLWLILRAYVRQVGIDVRVTPQILRHSVAAHMLNAGATLEEVQEKLGHISSITTQNYQQFSQEQAPNLIIDGKAVR